MTMAEQAVRIEDTMELPLDIIKASSGFSLDIGGSVAKLIYRSKEDFVNGEPKNRDQSAPGKGTIRMTLFACEKIEHMLKLIKENCDITPDKNGAYVIYSTGIGGNKFKVMIEGELNVRLVNLSEMVCFAEACCLLLKTKSGSEIFKPKSQLGLDQAKEMMKVNEGFKNATEQDGKGTIAINPEEPDDDYSPDRSDRFPFVLALCGSGLGFLRVEEDATYSVVDATNMAGRFFLGLVSFLTNIQDYDEIAKLVQESDGKTVDTLGSDVVDPDVRGDVYSTFRFKLRAFPFGKGLSNDRDKATKGDMIHSLLETICENMGHLALLVARGQGVPRVYFVGNFVNIPKAQQFITRSMQLKLMQPGANVNYEFLQHGGFLGAVGAFCMVKSFQNKIKEQEGKKKE